MRKFTLIEVVTALVILSVSLASLLQLMTSAQTRLAQAETKWRETHILMQAAEYYLLTADQDSDSLPSEIFPYSDYSARASYDDAENIPEDFTNLDDQLALLKCTIELIRNSDQKVIETIIVDMFDYEGVTDDGTTIN